MSPEAYAAAWFAVFLVPVCVLVAYTDLKSMKIPNRAVVYMVLVFAIGGVVLFPFDEYLWRWLHLVVVLAAGVALNAAGALGAGDAKFMAAAAPFVALGDLALVFWLLAATSMAGFAAHRLARMTPVRELAPEWESWHQRRRFPMGYPLGAALSVYLILKALGA